MSSYVFDWICIIMIWLGQNKWHHLSNGATMVWCVCDTPIEPLPGVNFLSLISQTNEFTVIDLDDKWFAFITQDRKCIIYSQKFPSHWAGMPWSCMDLPDADWSRLAMVTYTHLILPVWCQFHNQLATHLQYEPDAL